MPSFDIGPIRGAKALEPRITRENREGANAPSADREVVAADPSTRMLDAGTEPVNHDRVAEIRKAIENGTYPLVPQKIADAMIAAGYLLRTPK